MALLPEVINSQTQAQTAASAVVGADFYKGEFS